MARLLAAGLPTPFGTLEVVVDPGNGALRAAGFGPRGLLVARLQAAARLRDPLSVGPVSLGPVSLDPLSVGPVPVGTAELAPVAEAVVAYVDGDFEALDRVTVEQPGGSFLRACWQVLRQLPSGQVISYTGLAAEAGRPRAVRAAGQACARNLVAPFVPCHRVIRNDGGIGHYGYGVHLKQTLLRHEGLDLTSS